MKPILHSLAGGGSQWGLSHHLNVYGCGTRGWLDKKASKKDEEAVLRKKSALLTGIIGHALIEHYWKAVIRGETGLPVVEFNELVEDSSHQEALRCVKAFIARIGDGPALGEVLGVEMELAIKWDTPPQPWYQPDEATLTGEIDLLTSLKQKDATRLGVIFNEIEDPAGIFGPGKWIWDYKFRGRRLSNLMDKALEAWQYVGYPWMLKEQTGHKVKGCINVGIFTTKEVGFQVTVVPYPSQRKIDALKRLVEASRAVSPNSCRPLDSECFPFGRVCRYLHNGCERGVM